MQGCTPRPRSHQVLCVQDEPVATTRRVAWPLDGYRCYARNLCLVGQEDHECLRKHIQNIWRQLSQSSNTVEGTLTARNWYFPRAAFRAKAPAKRRSLQVGVNGGNQLKWKQEWKERLLADSWYQFSMFLQNMSQVVLHLIFICVNLELQFNYTVLKDKNQVIS